MSWAEDNGYDVYDGDDFPSKQYNHFANSTNSPDKWKTKDGRILPISDMTDNHLCNAIESVLRGNGNPYYLLLEFYRRNKDNK